MSAAALLLCLVVGVHDGDTITVRCGQSDQQKIRLAEIDAPELRQPFGRAAKQMLSDGVYGLQVQIEPLKLDRYGRTVARVYVEGQEVEWGLVEAGLAWCYEKYLTQPECRRYQDDAKADKRGVWSDPKSVPPWEWRHKSKKQKSPQP